MDTIGTRVREARQRRGMSRADLARAAGLSGGAVSRIESGERSPGAETLVLLARALGVELVELVEGARAGRAPERSPLALPAPSIVDPQTLPAEVVEAVSAVATIMPTLPSAGRLRVLRVLRAILDGGGQG